MSLDLEFYSPYEGSSVYCTFKPTYTEINLGPHDHEMWSLLPGITISSKDTLRLAKFLLENARFEEESENGDNDRPSSFTAEQRKIITQIKEQLRRIDKEWDDTARGEGS